MTEEEEIDRISRQIDEISKEENERRAEEIPQDNEELGYEGTNLNQEFADEVRELPGQAKNKSITELSEAGTFNRKNLSRGSKRSSKSYILKLRQDLENEREQRQKLENEIEELKKMSNEISSKLGIK